MISIYPAYDLVKRCPTYDLYKHHSTKSKLYIATCIIDLKRKWLHRKFKRASDAIAYSERAKARMIRLVKLANV